MKLKDWRWNKNYFQEEVSSRLGISQALLSRLEKGKGIPTVSFKRKFIEAYGEEEATKIDEFKLVEK